MKVSDFTFTKHALERILDMDLPPDEVRRCLELPRDVEETHAGDNRSMFFGERITCVVSNETNEVVTVLWRTPKYWQEDLSRGEYGGRSLREATK